MACEDVEKEVRKGAMCQNLCGSHSSPRPDNNNRKSEELIEPLLHRLAEVLTASLTDKALSIQSWSGTFILGNQY